MTNQLIASPDELQGILWLCIRQSNTGFKGTCIFVLFTITGMISVTSAIEDERTVFTPVFPDKKLDRDYLEGFFITGR